MSHRIVDEHALLRRTRVRRLAAAVACACLGGAWPALADQPPRGVAVVANDPDAPTASGSGLVAVSIQAETLTADGRSGQPQRAWRPAGRLAVDQQVFYTVRVHNPGNRPVTDVIVTKRLPFGVRYAVGSAVGPDCAVQVSTDGGASFRPADAASMASSVDVSAGSADYTHLRWLLRRPLAPGATALLRFRAVFN